MLPDSKLLNGYWVKGSLRSCGGNTAGHSTLLGNAISPCSHCLAEVQTTRIQAKPQNHTDSPLGPSTAGLQTACALWHSRLTLQRLLVKGMQTGIPGDKAALVLLSREGLRATTGPCLFRFPIALLDPWSSHLAGSKPSEEARTNKGQASNSGGSPIRWWEALGSWVWNVHQAGGEHLLPPCIVPSFFLPCHRRPCFHCSDLTASHISYVAAEGKATLEH